MTKTLDKILKQIDPSLSSIVYREYERIQFEIYEKQKNQDQLIFRGWCGGEDVNIHRWSAGCPLHELTFLTPYQVRKAKKVVKDFFTKQYKKHVGLHVTPELKEEIIKRELDQLGYNI